MTSKLFSALGKTVPSKRVLAVGLVAAMLLFAGCMGGGGSGDGAGTGTAAGGAATDAGGAATDAGGVVEEETEMTTDVGVGTEMGTDMGVGTEMGTDMGVGTEMDMGTEMAGMNMTTTGSA